MPHVNTEKPLTSEVINKFLQHCIKGIGNQCWAWNGPIHKISEYGVFEIYNIEYKAHRISFFYHNKRTKESEFDILHKCDNRWCVNPNHLYEGTSIENNRDKAERGEGYNKGIFNHAAIITEEDIPKIFKLRSLGRSQQKIAEEYGVTFATIGKILRRKTWKHVKIDRNLIS